MIRWLASTCPALRSRNLNLVAEFVRIPRWFDCELSASAPLSCARRGRILTNSATRGTSDKVAVPMRPALRSRNLKISVAEFVRIPADAVATANCRRIRSAFLRLGEGEFSRILLRGERVIGCLAPTCPALRSRNLNLVAEFVRIPRWFDCELSASAPLSCASARQNSHEFCLRGERVIRWLVPSRPALRSRESRNPPSGIRRVIPRWFDCELSASASALLRLGEAEFSRILLRGERVIRWLALDAPCSP